MSSMKLNEINATPILTKSSQYSTRSSADYLLFGFCNKPGFSLFNKIGSEEEEDKKRQSELEMFAGI